MYLFTLFFTQESEDYKRAVKDCHQRSADRLVMGSIQNGGLYVKLGQGLACLNHILPREYTDTMQILQDRVSVISVTF